MSDSFESLRELCTGLGARIYPRSIQLSDDHFTAMADFGDADAIVTNGFNAGFGGELRSVSGRDVLVSSLTHENVEQLRRRFPFCAPSAVLGKPRTLGVGDRLGIATPGHIQAFEHFDANPVLAQQSIRELTLTGRTFEQVLDAASCGVFREGFRRAFGADGDHLKTPDEVAYAIRCGYTMITLDCSEFIRNDIAGLTDAQVQALPFPYADLYKKYDGFSISVEGFPLRFGGMELIRMLHIYGAALDFACSIYERFLRGTAIDFEISIDETATPTTPPQHFFVANELLSRGVEMATVAPRFCGEFQKGIDYIGDLAQFRAEFAVHAAIARHFAYKLSIHSGSDKFSVFPIAGELTQGRFHVKTAGTNWLEAMRLVAIASPALYREIHAFALEHFAEAKKYYHVTTDLSKVPPLRSLQDGALPSLFDLNEARQLIHITYGLILSEKDASGYRFRTRLYDLWRAHASDYAALLERHIGRHMSQLCIPVL